MNTNPVPAKNQVHKFFLGIITIHYLVEDRMPHLKISDSKYKHYINVYVFGKICLSWVFRTELNDHSFIHN